jgi:7,8-dihydroneopterin aldolase/epimerase/oxygenase
MIVVEVAGLELHGHHGASEEEQERGQRFLFDLTLEVSDAALSDRLADAVDYRDVVRCVRDVSDSRRFALLESLAGAAADAILARFPVEQVRVRVRKPEVRPAGFDVEWTAATVERSSRP